MIPSGRWIGNEIKPEARMGAAGRCVDRVAPYGYTICIPAYLGFAVLSPFMSFPCNLCTQMLFLTLHLSSAQTAATAFVVVFAKVENHRSYQSRCFWFLSQ